MYPLSFSFFKYGTLTFITTLGRWPGLEVEKEDQRPNRSEGFDMTPTIKLIAQTMAEHRGLKFIAKPAVGSGMALIFREAQDLAERLKAAGKLK